MTTLRQILRAYDYIIVIAAIFVGFAPPEAWPYAALVGLALAVALLLTRQPGDRI